MSFIAQMRAMQSQFEDLCRRKAMDNKRFEELLDKQLGNETAPPYCIARKLNITCRRMFECACTPETFEEEAVKSDALCTRCHHARSAHEQLQSMCRLYGCNCLAFEFSPTGAKMDQEKNKSEKVTEETVSRELDAIRACYKALEPLTNSARYRVIQYLGNRFNISRVEEDLDL